MIDIKESFRENIFSLSVIDILPLIRITIIRSRFLLVAKENVFLQNGCKVKKIIGARVNVIKISIQLKNCNLI